MSGDLRNESASDPDSCNTSRREARGAPLPFSAGGEAVDAAPPTRESTGPWLAQTTPAESPATAPLAVDLIGDYALMEEIARGGMGIVFRARQVSLDRAVALKMILSGRLAGPAVRERFRLEAASAARLDHPNIVPIYEVGEEAGQHFFSMRLMEGGSLAQRLDRYANDPRAAANVLEKIARAAHYAHQHGILHRDLKPANILFDAAGEPHISDFGLAKWAESGTDLTQSNTCLGTPAYMAPEQARGTGQLSTAADVYSLGAILYQMLTGIPPFPSRDVVKVLRQVAEEEPAAPRSLRPRVPHDLEAICLKCLRKEPTLRYLSAEALADDLHRFGTGMPIAARRVGSARRIWSWCRRKPALAAAAGAAAMATLAALVILSVSVVLIARGRAHERQLNAGLLLEIGNRDFAAGDAAHGLLGLADGLQKANQSDAAALQQTIRQQLGVWGRFIHPLRCVVAQGAEVEAVAISADGAVLVTAGEDQAQAWDVASGAPIGTPLRHGAAIRAVALDPAGKRALTGGDDGSAALWELASGRRIIHTPAQSAPLAAVALSPDGRVFVTASDDKRALIWDAASGSLLRTLQHNAAVRSIVFSPDSRSVLTGAADGTLRIWDAQTGDPAGDPLSAGEPIRAACFLTDGGILSVTSQARVLGKLSPAAGERAVAVPQGTHSVAVCGRGMLLTGGDDSLARLWDLSSASEIGPPISHPGRVTAAAISADGTRLATGCVDGTARIWGVATGQALPRPLRADGPIRAFAVCPGGGTAVTGDASGSAIVWDLLHGKRVATLRQDRPVMAVACASAAATVVAGREDGRASVFNGSTGQALWPPLFHSEDAWVNVVALSPDGRRALTGGNDGMARLWDLNTGRPSGVPMRHQEALTAASFSHDGARALTASRDGSARLWDAVAGSPLGQPLRHDDTVWAAQFGADDRYIVTTSADRTARLWDARTGEPLGAPLKHEDEVLAIAFSAQGTTMATSCRNGTVYWWDMNGVPTVPPRLLHRIQHGGMVGALAFSPDGQLLLAGGSDNTARLWDVATADPVGPPLHFGGAVIAAGFDQAGKLALTASADGDLRLWAVSPAEPDAGRLVLSAEVLTGMARDADGTVRWLTVPEWWERCHRLQAK